MRNFAAGLSVAVALSCAFALGGARSAAADDSTCGFDIFVVQHGVTADLTRTPANCEFNPDWSIDGKRVVYDRTGVQQELFTTELASGATAPVPGAPDGANNASYSPNGSWLAFDRFYTQDKHVYVMPADGGVPAPVVDDASDPDWSPNSHSIVFERPSDGSIDVVNLATSAESQIAPPGTITCFGFQCGLAWSPNGQYVAFSPDGLSIEVVRVSVSGQPLSAPLRVTDGGPYFESQPAFTGNSKTLLFTSNLAANGRDQLWSVPVSGGIPTVVWTDSQFSYDPAVARGGGELAYAGSTG